MVGPALTIKENIYDEDQRRFHGTNDIFVGAVLNVLVDHLIDVPLHITHVKILCDHLKATYGALNACSELYIMERFNTVR